MKPLLVFGTGEMAELAHFYFSRRDHRQVVAFTVDRAMLTAPQHFGLPTVAFEDLSKLYPPHAFDLFIAIGSSRVNRPRAAKCAEARALGYALATFTSPDAVVHAETIGDNCLIMDANNIHPFVKLGNNIIFSNDNHIGHHSTVEDDCFITSNVVVGGGVTIGQGSFLGVNATVRDHITIGKYNVIGAGAMIMADTPDFAVFSVPGTTARKVTSDRIRNL